MCDLRELHQLRRRGLHLKPRSPDLRSPDHLTGKVGGETLEASPPRDRLHGGTCSVTVIFAVWAPIQMLIRRKNRPLFNIEHL
jgi:hypothetical protein